MTDAGRSAWAGPARHARLLLAGNRPLLHAVRDAFAATEWPSATLQIQGGPMARAVYHCSILTPGGPRWIDYGPARTVAAPASIVLACATFGRDRQGGPALHCHAILSGPGGLVGGHLAPDQCIIGDDGLEAYAISAPSAGFTIQRDPATGFDLLAPAAMPGRPCPNDPDPNDPGSNDPDWNDEDDLMLLRLGPGEDLVAGIEAAARSHGIADARIHAGPGSLMRATLQDGATLLHAPGPAAEILVMLGQLRAGRATLHGAVGDPDGNVYAGQFVSGENPVCITVELALERQNPSRT